MLLSLIFVRGCRCGRCRRSHRWTGGDCGSRLWRWRERRSRQDSLTRSVCATSRTCCTRSVSAPQSTHWSMSHIGGKSITLLLWGKLGKYNPTTLFWRGRFFSIGCRVTYRKIWWIQEFPPEILCKAFIDSVLDISLTITQLVRCQYPSTLPVISSAHSCTEETKQGSLITNKQGSLY